MAIIDFQIIDDFKRGLLRSLNLNLSNVDDFHFLMNPIMNENNLWKLMDSWKHSHRKDIISFSKVYGKILESFQFSQNKLDLKLELGERYSLWESNMKNKNIKEDSPQMSISFMQWASIFAPDLIPLAGKIVQSHFNPLQKALSLYDSERSKYSQFSYHPNLKDLNDNLNKSPSIELDLSTDKNNNSTIRILIKFDHLATFNIKPSSQNKSESSWFDPLLFSQAYQSADKWSTIGPISYEEVFGENGLLCKIKTNIIVASHFHLTIRIENSEKEAKRSSFTDEVIRKLFGDNINMEVFSIACKELENKQTEISIKNNSYPFILGEIMQNTSEVYS